MKDEQPRNASRLPETVSLDSVPEELLEDKGSDCSLNKEDMLRWIRAGLKRLNEKERAVIVMRYGLITGTPLTMEETARHFNTKRENIRMLENRAMRKIMQPGKITGFLPDSKTP